MKILLAEDTKDLNKAVTTMLAMQGNDVDPAYDGEEAEVLTQANGYDLIILDIMMPKKNGLEVLAGIRERKIDTPVLMLTAKAEIDDRVAGLDAGADDYLTKPFAMKELLARVRALGRRAAAKDTAEITFGDITLKPENLELAAENSVRLSLKEFELLRVLVAEQGKAVDTVAIVSRVWHDDQQADADTVWLYINYLKSKLKYIDSKVQITGDRDLGYAVAAAENR